MRSCEHRFVCVDDYAIVNWILKKNFSFVFYKTASFAHFHCFCRVWEYCTCLPQYKGSTWTSLTHTHTPQKEDAHWKLKLECRMCLVCKTTKMRWFESLSPPLSSKKRFGFFRETHHFLSMWIECNWMVGIFCLKFSVPSNSNVHFPYSINRFFYENLPNSFIISGVFNFIPFLRKVEIKNSEFYEN